MARELMYREALNEALREEIVKGTLEVPRGAF